MQRAWEFQAMSPFDAWGNRIDRIESERRLFTGPLAKRFAAKRAVRCAAEAMESSGGAGYVEDTGVPMFMRDTLVVIFVLWLMKGL
jgi:alkylation response protein AidB-like acyl-CoA dehydrogenase